MDKSLKAVIEAAVAVGLNQIPAGAPDHVKELASVASKSAVEFLIESIEPKALKLKVKKGAKATATIK